MYDTRANLIIGFHGCDECTRDELLMQPHKLRPSKKPFNWLGNGMYFWENNLGRAMEWAEAKKQRGSIKTPAVIGAVLELGHCCDLLDERFIRLLTNSYEFMKVVYNSSGEVLPENRNASKDSHKDLLIRELDCSVIEFMHAHMPETRGEELVSQKGFDSTRGVFTEGGPAFPGAGIFAKSHIQICIRNPNCIKGLFLPRNDVDFPGATSS